MKRTVKVLWGDKNMIVLTLPDQAKIERARELIQKAMQGKLDFGYTLHKRKRGALYAYYESELRDLEWQRMHHVDEDTAWQWTAKMRGVRDKRNASAYRNEYAYNRAKRNYEKLRVAITLLQDEGEIATYKLHGTGYFSVEWFTGYDTTEIEVFECKGWETEKLPEVPLSNKIHVADLSDAKLNQGKVPYVAEDTTGQGELLPGKLADRDKDRQMFKSLHKGRYEAGKEWRNKQRLKRGEKVLLWDE